MKNFSEHIVDLKKLSLEIRLVALKMMSKAGYAHVGGALSMVDLMVGLYFGEFNGERLIKVDAKKPGWLEQDYVLMSKPYGVAVWYAILAELGFFDKEELNYFAVGGSHLQGYANSKVLGVPVNMGLLGSGVGAGVGLALALKMERMKNRVVVVAGDAEVCQGEVWESVMLAGHHRLDNLVMFIDKNSVQFDGIVRNNMMMDPLPEKLEAFGWKVVQIRNGHDFNDILPNIERAFSDGRHPVAVICKTVKGRGLSFAEGKNYYHNQVLSGQEMAEAVAVLEEQLTALK